MNAPYQKLGVMFFIPEILHVKMTNNFGIFKAQIQMFERFLLPSEGTAIHCRLRRS